MLSNTVLSVWNFLPTLLFAFQICTFPLSQLKYFRLWNFLLWCGLKTYLHRSQLISLTHTNEPMGSRTYLTAAAKSSSVVSDSVRPHRGQPTRLPCPWDTRHVFSTRAKTESMAITQTFPQGPLQSVLCPVTHPITRLISVNIGLPFPGVR